jgi:hypothetical protein
MVKKLNELVNEPKDPVSTESQEFLAELHARSEERQIRMKKMIDEWLEEDQQNAAN